MDSRLSERLEKWDRQLVRLSKVEMVYLELEATEKSLEGMLFLNAEGKNIEEKKAQLYVTEDWKVFKKDLAKKKAEYLNEKRILDLQIKAFEAEYITYRIEAEIIKKGHGGQL